MNEERIDAWKAMESRIEQWRLAKYGKFSASNIYHLMIPGKGMDTFSTGGITYIDEVALEAYTVYCEDEDVETYDMKLGKMREPQAAQFYFNVWGLESMEYFGGGNPKFFPYGKYSGVSPDIVMWKDEKNEVAAWGSELKCPSKRVHKKYLEISEGIDLKMVSEQYYAQCQMANLVFKTDFWHFTSYNEFFPLRDQMHIVEVKRDEAYISKMDMRIKLANQKKEELIEKWKNRKIA